VGAEQLEFGGAEVASGEVSAEFRTTFRLDAGILSATLKQKI
jgi:hypothetical protein